MANRMAYLRSTRKETDVKQEQETLYVKAEDKPVWAAAGRLAKRKRMSKSAFVAAALRDYVPRAAAEPDPEPEDPWAAIAADEASAA